MNGESGKQLRVAILDLYNGMPNQGMRCLRETMQQFAESTGWKILYDEFDVRRHGVVPDTGYNVYISSGGPGSPLESEGEAWDNAWMQWLEQILAWNNNPQNFPKKQVFFICHSFQLACRYFKVGLVCPRKSTAFGVFPVHLIHSDIDEPVFRGLKDPFYAVDSRDFQVIQPNYPQLRKLGARLLCIEKERPHVPLERAIMAIRFNEHMIGTQFHPEADALGMSMYLQQEDKRKTVIENHGFEKWKSMIEHLEDPDKIMWTYTHILPNFLHLAVASISTVAV